MLTVRTIPSPLLATQISRIAELVKVSDEHAEQFCVSVGVISISITSDENVVELFKAYLLS